MKKSTVQHALHGRSEIGVATGVPFGMLAGITLIALCVFIAYWPSLNGGFIWDDEQLLTDNRLIKASDGLYRLCFTAQSSDYWPATYSTFWIEWRLWEKNPTGYHAANMVLHVLEALLIWIILRRLSIPGAFLAAVIFAVHPVNVESVAWIAQRKNLMAMLFFLLSILWYLKFLVPARVPLAAKHSSFIIHHSSFYSWYWLSLAAFLLAMLSKGSVAILPVLLLGITWWMRPLTMRDMMKTAPFFIIAALLAGVNVWFQTHGTGQAIRTASFAERLLGAGGVVWFYIYKALLPINLAFVYQQWHIDAYKFLWWLPLLFAVGVTVVLWLFKNSWSRPFLFAWGFFCTALVPVMGFVDVYFMKYSLAADHYQHIAIIGVIALVSALWSTWHKRSRATARGAAFVIALIATGILISLSYLQNGLYRDEVTLLQDTLKKSPDCWMAHNNYGSKLLDKGQVYEAMDHFQRALQVKADHVEAINNMGYSLLQLGRIQESIGYFRHTLELSPDYPQAHCNLANALVQTGRIEEAIEHYEMALKFKSNYVEAHNNLGVALSNSGRLAEAVPHYLQALALKPDYIEAHNNLGVAFYKAGRNQEAIEHFERVLQIKPDYIDAYNNLGNVYRTSGQNQLAIDQYRKALSLKSDYVEAYFNMALAYANMHQTRDAAATAQKALELARFQGRATVIRQIEDWLKSYGKNLDEQ